MGGPDEYAELTLGANYRPHPNMILRPEFRIQEFEDSADQSLFVIDAIITF